ncbi:sialoadhesin-like [Gouania willdenowi]|uniref:sialoadhesin-like n=1 Tax=Gouania willdenowi TaxID=441366 RepID=UPI0010544728|nr:sialoadhesin-like [Gouania willdenowi]
MEWFVKVMRAYIILNILVSGALVAHCTNLFLTAPKYLEALNGSCLQIPCNFSTRYKANGENFDDSRDTFGVWIKGNPYPFENPESVVYNSSKNVNKYPMNITGNLRNKNCTTLFSNLITNYTATYFLRIINWPFRASADIDSIQIKIEETPWKPTLEIPGDLKENDSVSVSCSALTPCPHSPPQLTWSHQRLAVSHTKENHDRTLSTKIQENITLSDQHDGLNISCSASYPVGGGRMKTSEAAMTLSVSYAPKDTSASISPSALVSAGSWVNLTCSSRAKPAVSSFSWFRISQGRAIRESEGHLYSFNVSQGGVYYCVATNNLGNQTSQHIYLSVHDPGSFSLKKAVLGGVFGIIGVLVFVFIVCWLTSKHSTKSKQQTQTVAEMVEEDIHYGEIDFSRWAPGSSPSSVQDDQQPQETMYAEIKGNQQEVGSHETENTPAQAAADPHQVYAQVNKT